VRVLPALASVRVLPALASVRVLPALAPVPVLPVPPSGGCATTRATAWRDGGQH
jgi:hypothetical protein